MRDANNERSEWRAARITRATRATSAARSRSNPREWGRKLFFSYSSFFFLSLSLESNARDAALRNVDVQGWTRRMWIMRRNGGGERERRAMREETGEEEGSGRSG